MGVKSFISLEELNRLFDEYNFLTITPTTHGVVDTTYIVTTANESYILKHFERDIREKIQQEALLLKELSSKLKVPFLIAKENHWYLYKKLSGASPKQIHYYHITALARFLASLHTQSKNIKHFEPFIKNYPLETILKNTKKEFYSFYKKLASLKSYKPKYEGFIHGDIFKDNTVFNGNSIGVFDFIDGGGGEFAFDVAVALIDFNPSNKQSYNRLFLQSYNQKMKKKISLQTLQNYRTIAAKFYALLRIDNYNNTKKANELVRYI
ncbi:phosphotransferase [Sulfurimonas sp.]